MNTSLQNNDFKRIINLMIQQQQNSDLWIEPATATEEILQEALRAIHALIEECWMFGHNCPKTFGET